MKTYRSKRKKLRRKRRAGSKGLNSQLRLKMESAFDSDFSGVNIVKDSSEAESRNALAFTQNEEIHFAPGQFAPNTEPGQELIAHELAHVEQQRNVDFSPAGPAMELRSSHLESEGDRAAASVMSGGKASVQGKAVSSTGAPVIQKRPKATEDKGSSKHATGFFDALTGLYTIAKGDYLSSIADRFSTTTSELQKLNPQIKNINEINEGDVLVLPGFVTPQQQSGFRNVIKPDEYVKVFEKQQGRKMTEAERIHLARGCIGITMINIGTGKHPDRKDCYNTFNNALYQAQAGNTLLRSLGMEGKFKVMLFAKRFWTHGKAFPADKEGKVDMSNPNSTPRPGGGYTNFDFGFYDITTGHWWHANHCEPYTDSKGTTHFPRCPAHMKVYESSTDKFNVPLGDFNKTVYCLAMVAI